MRLIGLLGGCLAAACVLLAPPTMANTVLTGSGPGLFNFVTDGTSNTLLIGESTRLSVCFDQVGLDTPGSIVDGSSNTILLGESTSLTLQAGRVLPRLPIASIADGTSNTIFFGELDDSLCFAGDTRIVDPVAGIGNTIEFGDSSRFDICFRGARLGTIQDGTSNTIQFGEVSSTPVCFQDVEVAIDAPTAAAEPASLGAFAMALTGLLCLRRRRFTSASRRPCALAALGLPEEGMSR